MGVKWDDQGHHLLKSMHEIGCPKNCVETEAGRNMAAPRLGSFPGMLQAMGKNELILLRQQVKASTIEGVEGLGVREEFGVGRGCVSAPVALAGHGRKSTIKLHQASRTGSFVEELPERRGWETGRCMKT